MQSTRAKDIYKVKFLMNRKDTCQNGGCNNKAEIRAIFYDSINFPEEKLCQDCLEVEKKLEEVVIPDDCLGQRKTKKGEQYHDN